MSHRELPPLLSGPASVPEPPATATVASFDPTSAARPSQVPASSPTAPALAGEMEVELPPAGGFYEDAPPWLISAIVHMVLVIVLGLVFFSVDSDPPFELQLSYHDRLGDQLDEEQLQNTDDPLDVDEQVLTPDLLIEADDPLSSPEELVVAPLATVATRPMDAALGWALTGREKGRKEALLAAYGGDARTEAAVLEALRWLVRNQRQNGEWSLLGPYRDGANFENRQAATAMALLAFQGAGYTHRGGSHEFTQAVERGWKALLKHQDETGSFFDKGPRHHRLYTQAQCTIAICELYAMTQDSELRDLAQKAIDYCVASQAPQGGWRYDPGIDSDTSVTGWFVMALKSGQMAGLSVPSETFERTNEYLERAATSGGAQYSYRPSEPPSLSMTAEGLLCRQYLGWNRDNDRLLAGVMHLLANPVDWETRDVYYWYYATQVCHHMEGSMWQQWNRSMKSVLPEFQIKETKEKGSWPPNGDRWGVQGGRLFVTCLSTYMLEVYYRHLPIYRRELVMGR